jgi:hypothetical protein
MLTRPGAMFIQQSDPLNSFQGMFEINQFWKHSFIIFITVMFSLDSFQVDKFAPRSVHECRSSFFLESGHLCRSSLFLESGHLCRSSLFLESGHLCRSIVSFWSMGICGLTFDLGFFLNMPTSLSERWFNQYISWASFRQISLGLCSETFYNPSVKYRKYWPFIGKFAHFLTRWKGQGWDRLSSSTSFRL